MDAVQCRMARAALGLTARQLAEIAEVSQDAVARIEAGDAIVEAKTVVAVRIALESRGIEFINGDAPGVRLLRRPEPAAIAVEDLNAENDE